jgi:pyruvate kinase
MNAMQNVELDNRSQSAAEAVMTHQQAELVNLIHELTAIRHSMLHLETVGLQQAGEVHSTYLQSARNLFHYLALRRYEMRPIQERLSALGLSSLGRTESHVLTSVNKVLEALHRLAQIPVTEPASPAPINGFEEGRA